MTRWITFDQNTARELRSRVPSESVFEAPGRGALEYAVSSRGNVVAVLNTGDQSQCAVAVFRRGQRPNVIPIPLKPRHIRASGILGLGDEAVFEDEETPKPKSWWRRVWED